MGLTLFRIRKVKFKNHPILRNLELDFTLPNGNAADTVIFAGENGVGKSAVMTALYDFFSHSQTYLQHEAFVTVENERGESTLEFYTRESNQPYTSVKDGSGMNTIVTAQDFLNRYPAGAIYSDVDISFQSHALSSVTSLELDARDQSRRSSSNLPTEMNQLIIDIQAQDDADFARAARGVSPATTVGELDVPLRIPRFTNAFSLIFENLSYLRVDNKGGHKEILFEKYGQEVPIQSLSSGEKQIVYRGAFLLRDAKALSGALVFIDEPEISLHPTWQMKIMDYYKAIFTNQHGVQTSQIFCVTHSPFIIHNENRRNDKVIVLQRGSDGAVKVSDKPEYYECNSLTAVRDAFDFDWVLPPKQTVYVEGQIDEKYWTKAVEVFGLNLPFEFKMVGYVDEYGRDVHNGQDALKQASDFVISKSDGVRTTFLFDCDVTKISMGIRGNVLKIKMPTYEPPKGIKKGIENALVLDDIDIESFYTRHDKLGDYGEPKVIFEFNKMDFCNHICCLNDEQAKRVLVHLKDVALKLAEFFDEGISPSLTA